MKMFFRGGLVLLISLSACSQEQKLNQKYFDFDQLMESQVNALSRYKPVLEKMVKMDDSQSDTTFLPSAAEWTSEFEIFRDLDRINKPSFRGVYKIEDGIRDPKSNLLIRRYSTDKSAAPQVEFYYQNNFSRLKKIQASFTEKNLLFSTHRELKLEFEETENGEPLLAHYSITGFQKMILRDTVQLSLLGTVDW